jgi:hypothetical protein
VAQYLGVTEEVSEGVRMSVSGCSHGVTLARYHQEQMYECCALCGIYLGKRPWSYHLLPVVREARVDSPDPSSGPGSTEDGVLLEAETGPEDMADPELRDSQEIESVRLVRDVGDVDKAPTRQASGSVRGLHPANSNGHTTKLDEATNGQDHWSDPVEIASVRRRLLFSATWEPSDWSEVGGDYVEWKEPPT